MKIHTGFVSNSSSSSFVIVTTREKWNAAKKLFAENKGKNLAHVVIAELGMPEVTSIFGQNALVFAGTIFSEDFGYNSVSELSKKGKLTPEEEDNIAVDAYASIGEFFQILSKDGGSYASWK